MCALGMRRGTVVSEESPGSDTSRGAVIIVFNYTTGLCQEGGSVITSSPDKGGSHSPDDTDINTRSPEVSKS